MKLQNFVIIFIIIFIPIIIIFSYYLNLQSDTIKIQTDYNNKLSQATKEAIEAFEINTVEWNEKYYNLADTKRSNVQAAINAFTTSLSNKIGSLGKTKEFIIDYIPAVVFTMYDGYYIYAQTEVPKTITNDNGVQMFHYDEFEDKTEQFAATPTQNINETIYYGKIMYEVESDKTVEDSYNGKDYTINRDDAKKIKKHILKNFIPYSYRYKNEEKKIDVTINYTLDNYIRIYGYVNDEYIAKEGYLSETERMPNTIAKNSISIVKTDKALAKPEILTEQIEYKQGDSYIVGEYNYVYDTNYEKYYYEKISEEDGIFFYLSNKEKIYLDENGTLENCKYKKLSLYQEDDTIKTVYQPLNVLSDNSYDTSWYEYNGIEYTKYENSITDYNEKNTLNERYYDYSATNYYIESYMFNKWVKNTFPNDFLSIDKTQIMKDSINSNLNEAISRYGKDFYLPKLTEEEWEQVFSNLSIITFFQGVPAGLKTYNNYSIATSTSNREFISENGLYYMGSDNFYHKAYCNQTEGADIQGYRSIEFNYSKSTQNLEKYYLHGNQNLACYDCIVNANKYSKNNSNEYITAENTAIARERYVQMQRTKLVPDAEEEPAIPDPTPEEPTPHTHTFVYKNINETRHQYICSECDEINSESNHSWVNADNYNHYCNFCDGEYEHEWEGNICKICGTYK